MPEIAYNAAPHALFYAQLHAMTANDVRQAKINNLYSVLLNKN